MFTVVCIILVISIGSRFSAYLNEAASGDLTKDVVVMLLAFRVPKLLELIVPVSFFISIILTFGGIWLLWKEITWFKYVVMVSGSLLTITFLTSISLIFWFSIKRQSISPDID